MTPDDQRVMLAAELSTIQRLAIHLDQAGLDEVRAWLRLPDTTELAATAPALRLLRSDVLEGVCLLLVDRQRMSRDHYEHLGDLPPSAPDDLSELDGIME